MSESNGQKKRAKFPALGAVVEKRFFDEEPKRGENEREGDFAYRKAMYAGLCDAWLDVELVDRDTVNEWSHRFDLLLSMEEKRKLDLEKAGSAVPTGFTKEGSSELRQLHFDVVKRAVKRAHQIDVGDKCIDEIEDRETIAKLLDGINLLADASRLAREAQRPTPAQSES